MKQLEKLSILLGTVSVIINLSALVCALIGVKFSLPAVFWGLHIGVFVCAGPPLVASALRIRPQVKSGNSLQNARDAGELVWEGIAKRPLQILVGYAVLMFVLAEFKSPQESEPWLLFSAGWMAGFYIAWQLNRRERLIKAV